MKKRIMTLLAGALCLSMALCGCQSAVTAGTPVSEPDGAASQVQAAGTLSVARTAAGTNPYLYDDVLTRQNAFLLFEPFVFITPDLDIEYRLAQSIDNSGVQVTIQMRSGCYFADGALVTAEDAAASLRAACASAAYGGRFANVTDVAVEGNAVCVSLAEPDSLFTYLLDIPILRADEVGIPQPTANGRYTYGSGDTLARNPRASFASGGPEAVELVTVANADDLVSGLAKGTVDLYLPGDSDVSATINTTETYYRSNGLVFLGINSYSANPLCNTAAGRALLSALCDRYALVTGAFASQGYPALGAVNSFYPCVKGRQTLLASADAGRLEAVMAELGYTMDAESGWYLDARKRPAAVSLLVYGGSSYKRAAALQLQQQWQSMGIQAAVTEASSFDDYLLAVRSGEFELYIGEMKLYNNIDLSPFWSGEASYGLAPSEALLAAYSAFRLNAGTAADFEAAFAAEMPYIPLLWHSGAVVASRRVSGIGASLSSPFYALDDMRISE